MSIQAISARLHQEGVEHRVVIANDIYKEVTDFEDKLHSILESFVGKKASVEAIQKALQTKLVIKGKYKPSQLGVARTGVGNIRVVWAYRTDKGIETKKSYILGVVEGKITEVNG